MDAALDAGVNFSRRPSLGHGHGRSWVDRHAGVRIGYTRQVNSAGARLRRRHADPRCELPCHVEEVADNVTGHLVPDAGHWTAEENPDYFTRMFLDFDATARQQL
jgi:hypothetical protein